MKTNIQGDPYLSWVLRILLIIGILFISLFSLDVFEEGKDFWETLADFFMHNLPSFIMIIILIIAWRNELIGGILLMLGVLGFEIYLYLNNHVGVFVSVFMLGIPFLIGALFVVNHNFLEKKASGDEKIPGDHSYDKRKVWLKKLMNFRNPFMT